MSMANSTRSNKEVIVRMRRDFLRKETDMPLLALRVLLNGLTYPVGWNPKRCAHDTKLGTTSIYTGLHWLEKRNYAVQVPHPTLKRKHGWRFTTEPGTFKISQQVLEKIEQLDPTSPLLTTGDTNGDDAE